MSYLGKILFVCGYVILLLVQCEDTKNKENAAPINSPNGQIISTDKTTQTKVSLIPNDSIPPTKKLEKLTQDNVVRLLTAPYGTIVIQLFKDTPLHRANFIYLVKQGYFNSTYFHRVVSNFIIQAGSSDNALTQKDRYALGHTYRIPNEIKHKHFYGSLSGAKYYRDNDDHKTEPFEFFIFLGPTSSTTHLDGNYTVFGKVIEGMDVVTTISKLLKDAREWPLKNVTIKASLLP
jgi:peptidyl-prolyl cis-trans isomerase A (cyclophilin A)